jgi:hypothetical protein
MSGIQLDEINYDIASIQIKDAAGDALAVNNDGSINAVVTATDLDIRNLVFATDKVDVTGSAVSITGDVNVTQGTSPWVVSATDLDIRNLVYTQDNVAIKGATGNQLVVNADGSLNVTAVVSEAAYSAKKTSQQSVSTVAQIAAVPFTGRKAILIQNVSNKDVYLGDDNTVTVSGATGGAKLAKGTNIVEEWDASVAIWAICDGGTADLRIIESK